MRFPPGTPVILPDEREGSILHALPAKDGEEMVLVLFADGTAEVFVASCLREKKERR